VVLAERVSSPCLSLAGRCATTSMCSRQHESFHTLTTRFLCVSRRSPHAWQVQLAKDVMDRSKRGTPIHKVPQPSLNTQSF